MTLDIEVIREIVGALEDQTTYLLKSARDDIAKIEKGVFDTSGLTSALIDTLTILKDDTTEAIKKVKKLDD